MVKNIFISIIAYILGSIPFGVLFARTQGINLREHGSGNIGATNVTRMLGKMLGTLTLLGDIFKGWIAVSLASWILNEPTAVAGAGIMAFLGHLFSIFLKFKGGKGVATGLGIHLFIMPKATYGSLGIFTFVLWVGRYVSLSSIFAAISLPIFGIFLEVPIPYLCLSILIAMLIIFKHQENIRRIIAKTEPHFP